MIYPEDYIGLKFGHFEILRSIGHGAEAEVYLCADNETGRLYALRLAVEDNANWEAETPRIPPINAGLEKRNAAGAWRMFPGQYKQSLAQVQKSQLMGIERGFVFGEAAIYGLVNERYLVPVSSAVRVKHSWDVDRVLATGPADDLFGFGLWEDVVLCMGLLTREADERWDLLRGGAILSHVRPKYLGAATMSTDEKRAILKYCAEKTYGGPEFAENLLLRLCGCVERGRMSIETARMTLRCPHFRANITIHEIRQIVAAYEVLQSSMMIGAGHSQRILEIILREMTEQPFDMYNDWRQFEERTSQPSLDRFSTFLQVFVGQSDTFLALAREQR